MILFGFVGGAVLGITLCRAAGGEDMAGILRGAGTAGGAVWATITAAGALAWAAQERPPVFGGLSFDVAVEIRLPPGEDKPAFDEALSAYATLYSGRRMHTRTGALRAAEARQEQGCWIVPATLEILSDEGDRLIGVKLPDGATWYVRTDIPARPAGEDAAYGAWREPDRALSGQEAPPPPEGLALRYRVVLRPPSPD